MKRLDTIKNGFIRYAFLLLTVTFMACEKEGDKESPLAEIFTPEIGQLYYRGQVMYLNAKFIDNDALDRCEVNISATKSAYGWDDPWQPETDVIQLEGSSQILTDYLLFNGTIPFDIMSAPYVVNIRVFDKAGNMTHYSRQIEIE